MLPKIRSKNRKEIKINARGKKYPSLERAKQHAMTGAKQ